MSSFLIIRKTKKDYFKEYNIFTRDLFKVDYDFFSLDLLAIDMDKISNNPNANVTFNNLYEATNKVIDEHITDKEFKGRYKPWISEGILNSINRKNKLYSKYIRSKKDESK